MYFKATVAAVSATCLMSSCCTNTLMSASCAGITVEPCVGESLQGAVANGVIHASTGLFEVFLKMQQFPADSKRHAVELTDAYKISVSDDFLCMYFATLSWGHKCCVLLFGPESNLDEPVQSVPGGYAARMTAVWTGKGLVNGCHTFLAVCTDVKPSHTPLMHLVLQ